MITASVNISDDHSEYIEQVYEDHVTTRCVSDMSFDSMLLNAFDQLAPFLAVRITGLCQHPQPRAEPPPLALGLAGMLVLAIDPLFDTIGHDPEPWLIAAAPTPLRLGVRRGFRFLRAHGLGGKDQSAYVGETTRGRPLRLVVAH